MTDDTIITAMTPIKDPLLIMFRDGEDAPIKCIVTMPPDIDYRHYGLGICDAVRHIAAAYGVPEAAVWEYVDKERATPTTDLKVLGRSNLT